MTHMIVPPNLHKNECDIVALARKIPMPVKKPEYTPQDPPQGIITLDKLVIEEKSPRNPANNKLLYSYDKSLEALKARGFERHLRPAESSQILIDSLENPNSRFKDTAQDILSSYGEWISLVMLRESETSLICYLDPESLVWNPSTKQYEVQGSLKHKGEHKFAIGKDTSSQAFVDLNKLPQTLVEFLYSRSFDRLPEIMRTGNKRAQLCLPSKGVLRPVGRDGDSYGVVSDYDGRASRGVRERR